LNPDSVNKAWLLLALFAIGEKLSEGIGKDQINGVAIVLRSPSQRTLQIWDAFAEDSELIKKKSSRII